ncbi:MAG: hypothetical protein K8L97_27240 [Anaerolineae bacterium]|nr:hypothetical protein [Anaerolineae bacterium]
MIYHSDTNTKTGKTIEWWQFDSRKAATAFADKQLGAVVLTDGQHFQVASYRNAQVLLTIGYRCPATVKHIAYNPTTRRYEEVHPEDEVVGSRIIELVWSDSLQRWVTIPAE